LDLGNCSQHIVQYFYDAAINRCKKFFYRLRFHSDHRKRSNECSQCDPKYGVCANGRCRCVKGFAGDGKKCEAVTGLVGLGSNGEWEIRYYFDAASSSCRRFWYGGCTSANQNIFADAQVIFKPIYSLKNFSVIIYEPKLGIMQWFPHSGDPLPFLMI
uniref:BPTI/Kunitz inhibitor domain-containing protein n=1 Tax=Anisakis simplex TaxID=6269 RepID=A0A0M3J013_ANISI